VTGRAGQEDSARPAGPEVGASLLHHETTARPHFLADNHRAMLEASAIASEVSAVRGYFTATTKQQLAEIGFPPSQRLVPSLVVPIYDVKGDLATYQLRPDRPRLNKDSKTIKYETRAGSRLVVDVPPGARKWLGDRTRPLFITEGSKKADGAVSAGLCCVALLGVWNWRDSDGLLPDWEYIGLKERKVYVVFDSDVMEKKEVHQALERVKAVLEHHDADVALVYLPSGDGGKKVGLDDYLAAGHSVDDLLSHATTELRGPPVRTDPGPATPTQMGPPPDGTSLLADVMVFIRRYVVLSDSQLVAVALWVLHTWAIEAAEATPYLEITSAEKRSGKTRFLEVLNQLVARPWLTGHVSAAVLVRKVAQQKPTLLLDESDAAFRSDRDYAETLRGVLNSGHRRNGVVSLCVKTGPDFDLRDFPVFCPKAIAGIGKIPDTVSDRSVRIEMLRRAPGEHVERFRERDACAESRPIRDGLSRWAAANVDSLHDARPLISDRLDDRAADGWEPLLAIADAVGGKWPECARHAALSLSTGDGREDESIKVRLLRDIKTVFDELKTPRLSTSAILEVLNSKEDAPWGDYKGSPMNPAQLARLLKPYGVQPRKVREGSETWRGYERDAFVDPWSRYLSPERRNIPEHLEQAIDSDSDCVPPVPRVPGEDGRPGELSYCPEPGCTQILGRGRSTCPLHQLI